jgi:DNA-binding response OmpR family regulator
VANTTAGAMTVCIAEDNPILLEGLERALSANGYRVLTAVDGAAVLQLLKDTLPDVLLLDIMMPGMSGIDVLDAVRADARTTSMPVLLITAAAEEVISLSELAERGVEVLMKPFRLTELLSRIESLADGTPSHSSAGLSGRGSPRMVAG